MKARETGSQKFKSQTKFEGLKTTVSMSDGKKMAVSTQAEKTNFPILFLFVC